jgi:hypothetical protein
VLETLVEKKEVEFSVVTVPLVLMREVLKRFVVVACAPFKVTLFKVVIFPVTAFNVVTVPLVLMRLVANRAVVVAFVLVTFPRYAFHLREEEPRETPRSERGVT